MASIPLEWRTNLRTNLVLWPEVSPNIKALATKDGDVYDETALIAGFPDDTSDTRAVRNTFEVMAHAGFMYKAGDPQRLRLTALGASVLSFLGVGGGRKFASEQNRAVLAEVMIRGLAVVVEYRAVWTLMRLAGDMLSNEELNRAMERIQYLEDVPAAAEAILRARRASDPTLIGPRKYKDSDYALVEKRNDQRKAMNPIFLLAGGGWVFMSGAMEDNRRLEDWAVPLIDRRLEEPAPQIHASTDPSHVQLISEHSGVSPSLWEAL